jgi:hypothetical protein
MNVPSKDLPLCPKCHVQLSKHLPLNFLGKHFASCEKCYRMFPISKVWVKGRKEPVYEISGLSKYDSQAGLEAHKGER